MTPAERWDAAKAASKVAAKRVAKTARAARVPEPDATYVDVMDRALQGGAPGLGEKR
ncbi:MAG: hypothetical protein JWQ50_9707 [Caballeronia mineralivorans]|nr:hypothetical protein [Caballeronia mineralivorans]